MKTRYLLIALLCWFFIGTNAQGQKRDARNRVASTIVADGLAQLPAKDPATFAQVMDEIAKTGQEGMTMIVNMLDNSTETTRAPFEYAIDGVVSYVSDSQNKSLQPEIREALTKGIASCKSNRDKAFLMTELQKIATKEDAKTFANYLNDKDLTSAAVSGLANTPDINDFIESLILKGEAPKAALAYLAYIKHISPKVAEPALLSWLPNADETTQSAIYNALTVCGTDNALKTLQNKCKAMGYTDDPTGATDAYLRLLFNLKDSQPKVVKKAAKELMKTDKSAVRCSGLRLMLLTSGNKSNSEAAKALQDADRAYRNTALLWVPQESQSTFLSLVNKSWKKLNDDAKTDVVRWIGNRHITDETQRVIACMDSSNPSLAKSAISSAAKLGGQESLKALLNALKGTYSQEAYTALTAFNGDIKSEVISALDTENPQMQTALLNLCGTRRVAEAYPYVIKQLQSSDTSVKNAAFKALKGVARADNFNQVCDLLDKADETHVADLQNAAMDIISQKSAEEQLKLISGRMQAAPAVARYYPLLAQVNTEQAYETLIRQFYAGKDEQAAFNALLTVKNPNIVGNLWTIANKKPQYKDKALDRALKLMQSTQMNNEERLNTYRNFLKLKPSKKVSDKCIEALGDVPILPSLKLAATYLDSPDNQQAAASAVKNIIANNQTLYGCEGVKQMLEKSKSIYAVQKKAGDADAGYAMDQIDGLLEKVNAQEITNENTNKLTPEEKKAGFKMLFDGTNLDQWHGNKTNYVVDNGTIYISAGFGAGGNLYTNKKYSDFIYRFEFCFLEPGVNNGVGIRTHEGVDAAYEGMEIQILDHDAPIYANLHKYQQHGSVYGIIVPKHVNFGPVGKWHKEEIQAIGDHIKVTVDGEVILDGNIREACQGHNVAPDGSNHNPYTVDHNNHPGLFNKSGLISFCGHGPGLRVRNVRILDLSGKKKR